MLLGVAIDHCSGLHLLLRLVHVLLRLRVRSYPHVPYDWHLGIQEDKDPLSIPAVLLYIGRLVLHVTSHVTHILFVRYVLLFLLEWVHILKSERDDHLIVFLVSFRYQDTDVPFAYLITRSSRRSFYDWICHSGSSVIEVRYIWLPSMSVNHDACCITPTHTSDLDNGSRSHRVDFLDNK